MGLKTSLGGARRVAALGLDEAGTRRDDEAIVWRQGRREKKGKGKGTGWWAGSVF